MHIHKPVRGPSGWVVLVTENRSPLSKVLERIECSSREAAWGAYRHIEREIGEGL